MTHILTDIRYSQASNDDLTCFLELYVKAFPSEEPRAEWINENDLVELDEERKAAMVSNLLVVLCGNHDAQPIVNSGSLY